MSEQRKTEEQAEEQMTPFNSMTTYESSHVRGAYSADALKYLHELGRQERDFTVVNIDGHWYVNTGKLKRIEPVERKQPPVYKVFTLRGLIDYIVEDPDCLFDQYERLVLHVESQRSVRLYTKTYGTDNSVRTELASCACTNRPFEFNCYYGREDFMVALMSRFIQTDNAIGVGKLVGNLSVEDAVQVSDDGMNQSVTIKSGIARKASGVKVENPVVLAPIRSFPDIAQPESPFVLRIKNVADKEEPKVALFEADGDAWKCEAVQRIKELLQSELRPLIEDGKLSVIA